MFLKAVIVTVPVLICLPPMATTTVMLTRQLYSEKVDIKSDALNDVSSSLSILGKNTDEAERQQTLRGQGKFDLIDALVLASRQLSAIRRAAAGNNSCKEIYDACQSDGKNCIGPIK
jgi:hypothetical protein